MVDDLEATSLIFCSKFESAREGLSFVVYPFWVEGGGLQFVLYRNRDEF